MQVKRAVFLDKDGTLIPNIPYNVNPDVIELAEGVVAGLHLLVEKGYHLIVVTNQSGIAKGLFDIDALFGVRDKIERLLLNAGLPPLLAFYFCPHHPNGIVTQFSYTCTCRKPMTGLLEKAAQDKGISLKDSWMMGDILNDVEAGNRAGCKSILINNGNETIWEEGLYRSPFYIAENFLDGALKIVSS